MVSLGFETLSVYSCGWHRWCECWRLHRLLRRQCWKQANSTTSCHWSMMTMLCASILFSFYSPARKKNKCKNFCCRLSFFCQSQFKDKFFSTLVCKSTYSLKQRAYTNTEIKMHMHKPKKKPENKAIILFLGIRALTWSFSSFETLNNRVTAN